MVLVTWDFAMLSSSPRTFCNPIDLDYGYCPIPNFSSQGKHRATADPVIVTFRNHYYLFSTNQWGYWWSPDMRSWTFVERLFLKNHPELYDELCAPAVWVMDDAMFVIGSTYTDDFVIWKSENPQVDEWEEAAVSKIGGWDPAYFLDDDGRLYLYHGSSNSLPIYGTEIDRRTLQAIGPHVELIRLHDDIHGWERFGEHNDNTFLLPFLEGAWMTKHAGKYFLQYGAPGTEFSGYADGVYVSNHPLGPFTYQPHNPLSYKPGGFARGAGHGATYQDLYGNWWHVSTITIAVKNNFERRVGIWPAGFDADNVMFCNTAYGDYPWRLPSAPGADHRTEGFAGWMLLNYAKPVRASSTLGGFSPNFAVDESLRTYWSAKSGDAGEWFESDCGDVCQIHAIQINFADQDAEIMGKMPGLRHRYRLLTSADGQAWECVLDCSKSELDRPHAYHEFEQPIEARFVRIENDQVASGKFALSGLRVFGSAEVVAPEPVRDFVVLRGDQGDRRNAWLKWRVSDHATGYVVYAGIQPDKLYTSMMVYSNNELYFRAMDRDVPYYFQIEAFNEGSISARTDLIRAE